MAKSLEQRVGGPNSIDSLMSRGFYAEGPIAENDFNRIVREGVEYRVRPMSVTSNIGQSNERVVTVFKPVRDKRQ